MQNDNLLIPSDIPGNKTNERLDIVNKYREKDELLDELPKITEDKSSDEELIKNKNDILLNKTKIEKQIENYFQILGKIPVNERSAQINEIIRLINVQSDVNERNHKNLLKYFFAIISVAFILIPGFLSNINIIFSIGICSLGAVGFGAVTYDIYGDKAFAAGKSLRNVLIREKENETR